MVLKPLTMLSKNINNNVIVALKGNREYRGTLDGYDPHMNVVLRSVEEYVNGEQKSKNDIAVVRGDNVIYISP